MKQYERILGILSMGIVIGLCGYIILNEYILTTIIGLIGGFIWSLN